MPHSILIAEDERALREGLEDTFVSTGYSVTCAERGDAVIDACRKERPDLLLLDLMLPGKHGLDVCRELRSAGARFPIVMLTALASEEQIVAGLQAGADDYIVKPFRLAELIARVEAQIRRTTLSYSQTILLPAVELDLDRQLIKRDGEEHSLTQLESQVLRFLIQQGPEPVTRHELLREVWGYQDAFPTRTVDVAIGKLRAKLEAKPAKPDVIHTIRDRGYAWRPPSLPGGEA